MIAEIGGVTSQLIHMALDAASMRHQLIANNIANHSTPGYQAQRLMFEEHLQGITEELQSSQNHGYNDRIELLAEQVKEGQTIVPSDEKVELDREMVKLTENTLRYQALLKASSMRGGLISMAIQEGRR